MKVALVKDHPDLIRDMESKAILASDQLKYKEYKQKKEMLKSTMKYGEEIENLKKDVQEIRTLLQQLVSNFTSQP